MGPGGTHRVSLPASRLWQRAGWHCTAIPGACLGVERQLCAGRRARRGLLPLRYCWGRAFPRAPRPAGAAQSLLSGLLGCGGRRWPAGWSAAQCRAGVLGPGRAPSSCPTGSLGVSGSSPGPLPTAAGRGALPGLSDLRARTAGAAPITAITAVTGYSRHSPAPCSGRGA